MHPSRELKTVLKEKLNKMILDDFIAKVEGVEIRKDMLLGMMRAGRPRIQFDIDKASLIEGFLKTFIEKFNGKGELREF